MSNSKTAPPHEPNDGSIAEAKAAAWLQRQGLAVVERNYRCKGGEIDLIMRERNELVFVEVRLRKRSDYGSAAESVTATKQHRVIRAARHFLATHARWQNSACRFDVIAADDVNNTQNWQWLRHAFLAE